MSSLTVPRGVAVGLLALGLIISFTPAPAPLSAAPAAVQVAHVNRVIDGDTFVLVDGERIRVRNFDTPELRRHSCPAEKEMAIAARQAASDLLLDRPVTLWLTYRDRYGRWVADVVLERKGRRIDFVEAMISLGHGARWAYGEEPQPDWCARPYRRWRER